MASTRNLIFIVHDIRNMSEYNIQTSKWKDYSFNGDMNNLDAAQIFAKIRSATKLNKVKAMVFTVNDLYFPSLTDAYAFRLKCSEFCKKNGFLYFFIPISSILAFSVLSKAKVMVEENEEVMIICPAMDPSTNINKIYSNVLLRKKDHYEFISYQCIYDLQVSKQWKEKYFKNAKPKKVVLMNMSPIDTFPYLEKCASLFKDAVVVRDTSHFANVHDAIVQKVMHVMGDIISPYDATIQCQIRTAVFLENAPLITVEWIRPLPLEQSAVIDVDPTKSLLLIASCQTPKNFPTVFEEIPLSSFKCKKVKVILKIDTNSFHSVHVEPVGGDTVDEKLSKMDVADALPFDKVRLVFDKQNFTVYGRNDDDKEEIIHADDGSDKTPVYIAFTEKKPIIGKAAKEAFAEKPNLVVFDIIKLCSISNADVMNPKWGFKLEKENESIMVTVETVEGERRSSVEFLLALILKHALQIIKNRSGKKMDQIEIGFDGFSPNDILKKNFVDAGKLIKTDIVFV